MIFCITYLPPRGHCQLYVSCDDNPTPKIRFSHEGLLFSSQNTAHVITTHCTLSLQCCLSYLLKKSSQTNVVYTNSPSYSAQCRHISCCSDFSDTIAPWTIGQYKIGILKACFKHWSLLRFYVAKCTKQHRKYFFQVDISVYETQNAIRCRVYSVLRSFVDTREPCDTNLYSVINLFMTSLW